MIRLTHTLSAAGALLLFTTVVRAGVLGYTSFEEATHASVTQADVNSSNELTPYRQTPGTGDEELGYAVYMPTYSGSETFSISAYGVASGNGGNYPDEYLNKDGSLGAYQGFRTGNVPSGEALELRIDPVDISSATGNVTFSYSFVMMGDSGYESSDVPWTVTLVDNLSNSVTVTNYDTELGIEAVRATFAGDVSPTPWRTISYDITAGGVLTGSQITAIFTAHNDGGTENIFLDNIFFTDVPEPATVSLALLGGLLLMPRQRRRR